MSAGTTESPELTVARDGGRGRMMRWLAALSSLVALAAVAVAVSNPFAASKASGRVRDNGAGTSLAAVRRGALASQTQVSGTLGYAGTYSIVGNASGTATWLPSAGQVIGRGQVLYRVAGAPVVLLYGRTPAYRTLEEGMSGADVRQLNANLVALGYAKRSQLNPAATYFGWETAYALERLQKALHVSQTGELALGQAVFAPEALRITQVMATLGAGVAPGAPIAQASSINRHVTVNLDAAQQSSVKVGDTVTVTLPNGASTEGRVSSVGKVAVTGSSGSSTIPVYIALSDPAAARGLDQAPVEVQITTARVDDALIVPVNALLALAGGGYAVETVDAAGVHRLVPVSTGLFDDADGLVQVSGPLSAGDRVVVPSS